MVECSLMLMEMAEIEEEEPEEMIAGEEKQELVSKYLFGCAILRAFAIENREIHMAGVQPKQEDEWLSNVCIFK